MESLSDEIISGVAEPEAPVSVENQLQVLERVMNDLSPDEVKLLRMKHEEGLSVKEISSYYNISESAVKMRLKRTRDKLQELYLSHY